MKPRTALASEAGIEVAGGIRVDGFLETSIPGIFAAGDVAEWLDKPGGKSRRVEHWVVAERQGQMAARNMLGERLAFTDAPFFWSAHYDVSIRYVGHGEGWDSVEIDGDVAAGDASVRYKKAGSTIAVAAVGRDREALEANAVMSADAASRVATHSAGIGKDRRSV